MMRLLAVFGLFLLMGGMIVVNLLPGPRTGQLGTIAAGIGVVLLVILSTCVLVG